MEILHQDLSHATKTEEMEIWPAKRGMLYIMQQSKPII